MGWWQLDTDVLAGSRFVISTLAEATASLMSLHRATAAHPDEQRWLDTHRSDYQQRLADDPITALLTQSILGSRWIADFFVPAPDGTPDQTFPTELARIRAAPPATVHADLTVSRNGPLPASLHRSDLSDRAADLLEWVWTHTVEPDWPRRRQILDADIVARTSALTRSGWTATLDGLRPGTRWLGNGRLQINMQDYPPRTLTGAQLLLVPVTSHHRWVSWVEPHRYTIVYPCSGALAETDRTRAPEPLGRLLGPARAHVLLLLDTPKSTTHLVTLTGQRLGSIGRHLKILLDAHLVGRRRTGRSVLYYRTPAGDTLVQAQQNTHPAPPPPSRC